MGRGPNKKIANLSYSEIKDFIDLFVEVIYQHGRPKKESASEKVSKFLKSKRSGLFIQRMEFEFPYIDLVRYSFGKFLEELEGKYSVKILNFDHYTSEEACPPIYDVIKTDYNKHENVLRNAWIFIKGESYLKSFVCKIIMDTAFITRNSVQFEFTFNAQARDFASEIINKFTDSLEKYNFYRNKRIILSEEKVSFLPSPNVDWSQVFLPEKIVKEIERNIIVFLKNRKVWISHNILCSRSILLSGPPGTGKTLIGKLLATLLPVTFILVTPGALHNISSMADLFDFARKCQPSILFMEDLDLIGSSRESIYFSQTLGELLNQLDGMLPNDNLVIVATTNRPDMLDEALKDRPGRFDRHLRLNPPPKELREQMIRYFLKDVKVKDLENTINELIELTEGFTGAHIQELIKFAKIIRLNKNTKAKSLVLTKEDFLESLENLKEVKPEIGFIFSQKEEKL
ncbi:MAG: AAA family ATPase [Candidatus Helarchaeota archaeon]